jgi:RNA polymerase sigma factor (sigma-70 family)
MFKFPEPPGFLQRFREGERTALETVYFAYVEEVQILVRRFFSSSRRKGWGQAPIGDLVQDVFLRAFNENARRSFDGARDYGPFLAIMTRNILIDWARTRHREMLADDFEALPDLAQDADNWAERETMALVNEYIAGLPPELREVHERRYVHCSSQEDTCVALSISRQQLRTREKHLRDGLRRQLRRLDLGVVPTAQNPTEQVLADGADTRANHRKIPSK